MIFGFLSCFSKGFLTKLFIMNPKIDGFGTRNQFFGYVPIISQNPRFRVLDPSQMGKHSAPTQVINYAMTLTNHFNNRKKVTTAAVTEKILGTKLMN